MRLVRTTLVALVALTVLGAAHPLQRAPASDPARNLARVRLFVSTRAESVDVTVSNAWVASYRSSVISGPDGVRSSQTSQTLRMSRNTAGALAEAQFDVILSDVPAAGRITWNVTADRPAHTELEVQSLRDLARPRPIDRFAADEATARFTTEASLLDPGSIRVTPPPARLVLAQFYPWYNLDSWTNPELAARPLRRYSTDDQADVTRLAREARSAGIDSFDVSWQGPPDRRLRTVLDAAQNAGIRACAFIESFDANPANQPGLGADSRIMAEWIEYLVDTYSSHPAYLHIGSQPVILVYTASLLSADQWASLIARVRSSGRNPLVIGDFYHSPLLEPLDGEYQYINVMHSPDELLLINRVETLRVRTYSLLRRAERRRIWVASVSPGYNDSNVISRATHIVVPRDRGTVYDRMWSTAIDTAADWVVITTWNEWFEETSIEPGEKDGTLFLDRTRFWTREFKRRDRNEDRFSEQKRGF